MLVLLACAVTVWLAAVDPARAGVAYQQDAAHTGYSAQKLGALTARWRQTFPDEVVGHPLVADGRVIVITWGEGPSPTLRAFDEMTGRPLWAAAVTTASQLGEPAYDDGTVFLATSGTIQQSRAVGYMEAYDAATGVRRWRSQPHDRSIHDVPVTAAGGRVFLQGSSTGTSLLAFSQATGALLWDRPFGGGFDSAPTLSEGRAVVSHGERTSSIWQHDGSVAWARNGRLFGNAGRTAVAAGGLLYELDPLNWQGRISNAATGAQVATFPMGSNNSPVPAVGPGVWVYLADDQLIGRRVGSNEQLWTFAGDGRLRSTPLIMGDTAYVGSTSGRLYGVSLATGRQVWADDTGDAFRRAEDNDYSLWAGFGASDRSLVTAGTRTLSVYGGAADELPAPPSSTQPERGIPSPSAGQATAASNATASAGTTDLALTLTPAERRTCRRYLGKLPRVTPGTNSSERIAGTRRRDAVAAGAGRDRIAARDGGDCVAAGPGHDRLDGGSGRDVLIGGPGSDVLIGGPGPDILLCGPGRDTAYVGPGDRWGDCERVVRVRR